MYLAHQKPIFGGDVSSLKLINISDVTNILDCIYYFFRNLLENQSNPLLAQIKK